jgi:uncharacterized protein (DUF427 family)
MIANTHRAYRILETSQPPGYYIPPEDIKTEDLQPDSGTCLCEWKGLATYDSLPGGVNHVRKVAWYDPNPPPSVAAIKNCVAFYAGPMDACIVDGEKVTPQLGRFYGGWITSDIVGPFKGEPGTTGW